MIHALHNYLDQFFSYLIYIQECQLDPQSVFGRGRNGRKERGNEINGQICGRLLGWLNGFLEGRDQANGFYILSFSQIQSTPNWIDFQRKIVTYSSSQLIILQLKFSISFYFSLLPNKRGDFVFCFLLPLISNMTREQCSYSSSLSLP